jgi:hypothetical protein
MTEAEVIAVLAYIKTWWQPDYLQIQLERTQAMMQSGG